MAFNAHLTRLGWMAKLTKDEDWVVTVFPAPERQFPASQHHRPVLGALLPHSHPLGDLWMGGARPAEGWFHSSSFVDALIGYTLPVMLIIFVASTIQRRIAARFGVRSGHILPVPDFTIALYALGLFPLFVVGLAVWYSASSNHAEDGRSPLAKQGILGYTALSVPLVLGGAGAVLMFAGLSMTPEYLVSLTMPLVSSPPLFLSILADAFSHDDAFVRILWAHPWVHVGGMLMLFAWISLLPVPTFPGVVFSSPEWVCSTPAVQARKVSFSCSVCSPPMSLACLSSSLFGSSCLPCCTSVVVFLRQRPPNTAHSRRDHRLE